MSPPKVGLLALICIYTDSVVPTASTIPILSFIASHVINFEAVTSGISVKRDFKAILSIDDFQRATITQSSTFAGRTIWDLFLRKLWEINSLDALHVFFDNLGALLAKTGEDLRRESEQDVTPVEEKILLSRASPLGTFVRRAQMDFTQLQFHDAVALWKSFIVYRSSTLDMWRRRNPSAEGSGLDVNLEASMLDWEDDLTKVVYGDSLDEQGMQGLVSSNDYEKLLEFQVEEMQRLGNRVPVEVKEQFRRLMEGNVKVPSLSHYVSFLDAWRSGDYPSSFDNLHRYFDYTMHHRDRTFYQYALLNLAILQADFGCYSEAIAAMQETISTARENKDMGCLNFSLSWLYHFGKAHPGHMNEVGKAGVMGVEREGLAFLKAKAKEAGMWSLLSTSLLSEAKLGLSNGESVPLALENITRASHLNITKSITNAMSAQLLLQSSVFGRLGITHIAWSYCEIFLNCYAANAPFEEVLRCKCRSAFLLSQNGHYDQAMARMKEIDTESLRVLKNYQYVTIFSGILKLKRELHRFVLSPTPQRIQDNIFRDDLIAAEHLLSKLLFTPPSDPDIAFSLSLLKIDFLMRKGSDSAALGTLEDLATKLSDEGADIYWRTRLLSLKALLLAKCGRPQKGFSVALRAASIAHRARLLPALWEAIGAVANVLNSLNEFDAASKLLSAVMPQALECEDCALAAQLYSFLADAKVGLAGQAKSKRPDSEEWEILLKDALASLGSAAIEYRRVEDVRGQCEMLAKKSVVARQLDDLKLSNTYAQRYLEIKRAKKCA
ncbi:MAG: hypothetical protein M1819_000827 [Sarea resinae]|nr:MAG: hypothetical protein M1819_000827 [Sarea resinae]